jgi:hypothetical protein
MVNGFNGSVADLGDDAERRRGEDERGAQSASGMPTKAIAVLTYYLEVAFVVPLLERAASHSPRTPSGTLTLSRKS